MSYNYKSPASSPFKLPQLPPHSYEVHHLLHRLLHEPTADQNSIYSNMGQYWQLINLDKRQTFGHWGKLAEFIPSDRPASIIPYLVVPASPLPQSTLNANADLIGSWAGDRIICIGDYTDYRDYPKGLLTEAERRKITKTTSLYDIAYKKYDTVRPIRFPSPAAESMALAFAHDQVWVLRNLSKHQYVRVDALGADPKHVRGPSTRWGSPGLGDVLLPRIMWTSETGQNYYEGEIGRRSWAGDRFDIQTLDTVEGDDEWKDISMRVAREIERNHDIYF
ncbi:hypothetical protein Hypma_006271 [Hypsizygus marmoreus]|uniref:Uncharacterized protein n=1 Tax=Hypsizygus marmoreus TaxID=39966 RepID=A0A369JW15_HYPMA|nr:hypothetical protein Hypma_006271 [Hypsizygus marmoreus]